MDDDTDDFLPLGWTDNAKEKINAKSGLDPKKKDDLAILQPSKKKLSPEAPEFHSMISCYERVTLESTLSPGLIAKQETTESSATVSQTEPATLGTTRSPLGTMTHKKVTIARLEVPASLLRKPTSAVEDLQEQMNSLKQALKATKSQAAAVQSDLQGKLQKKDQELQRLHVELNDKNSLRSQQYLNLKNEREESEAQRIKTTDDYRKLMNESHCTKNKLASKLDSATSKLVCA
jgi:hypothetical protein